ncbi:hypothetical protein [Kitasatospora aureofaciens]|uniref:hypothetical protein n=1 Tax=Kitasatospora aureofaciens TaxID=1894 RepID=UPI0036F4778E
MRSNISRHAQFDGMAMCARVESVVKLAGKALTINHTEPEEVIMPPIPIRPGVYKIHAHIIGPGALMTATEYAVKYGAPVIVDRMNPLPIEQEWAIEPAEPVPGSPYAVRLATQEAAGLVTAEDKLWVNNVPRADWAKFTFEAVLGGVKILSEKGLAMRAGYRGSQIEFTPPQPEYQQTWTLEFVRPIDED